MHPSQMKELLLDISNAIDEVEGWKEIFLPTPPPEGATVQVFESTVDLNRHFTVACFTLPDGRSGYDGAVHFYGKIVHLTQELAERAFKKATKKG